MKKTAIYNPENTVFQQLTVGPCVKLPSLPVISTICGIRTVNPVLDLRLFLHLHPPVHPSSSGGLCLSIQGLQLADEFIRPRALPSSPVLLGAKPGGHRGAPGGCWAQSVLAGSARTSCMYTCSSGGGGRGGCSAAREQLGRLVSP